MKSWRREETAISSVPSKIKNSLRLMTEAVFLFSLLFLFSCIFSFFPLFLFISSNMYVL